MKTKHFFTLLGVTVGLGLMAGSAQAAVLSFYDIESNLTVADSTNATGLTASALDATSATGTSANFSWVGSRVPYYLSADINDGTDPTVDDIVATWNLAPDAGQQITINTTAALNFGVLAFSDTQTEGGSYAVYARVFIASDAAFTNILATSTILSNAATSRTNASGDETIGTVDLDAPVTSSGTLYFGLAFPQVPMTSIGREATPQETQPTAVAVVPVPVICQTAEIHRETTIQDLQPRGATRTITAARVEMESPEPITALRRLRPAAVAAVPGEARLGSPAAVRAAPVR